MGVEPTLGVNPNLISNQAPSATRPSLRCDFRCLRCFLPFVMSDKSARTCGCELYHQQADEIDRK